MDSEATIPLKDGEFAFYFAGEDGVDAGSLGSFLQRAQTIAKDQGYRLIVVGTYQGSLFVKLLLMRIAKGSSNETVRGHLATAADVATIATALAAAAAGISQFGSDTPLARAAADLLLKNNASKIEIVTPDRRVLVLDERQARQTRVNTLTRYQNKHHRLLNTVAVDQLAEQVERGYLTGRFIDVRGEFHFIPTGFSYLIPVRFADPRMKDTIFDGVFEVKGILGQYHGQPDIITIYDFSRVG